MIDREKLNKILDARDSLEGIINVEVTCYASGGFRVWVSKDWGKELSEENRHKTLAILTPLVGRMEKQVSGTDISYSGELGNVNVYLSNVDKCKIVGWKKVVKSVAKTAVKEVVQEQEVETGDFEEQEELVPITDCEIRMGKASESDIEVPA